MRALRFHAAGDVRVDEVEEQPLGPLDVRIAVAYCGICGTDVHEYVAGPRFIPPAQAPHLLTRAAVPVTLGHEFAGRVVEVGADVERVVVGDRVAVEPLITCGVCAACVRGAHNLCARVGFVGLSGLGGGLSERCVVAERWVHPIGSLPYDVAALAEPAAVAHHAVSQARVQGTDSVLIVGAGPVGLLAVACARRLTAASIGVVARSTAKAEIATTLGADLILDPAAGDIVAAVDEVTAGRGFDVIVECSGSADMFRACVDASRPGGRMIVAASAPEPTPIDTNLILAKEIALIGSLGYCGDFPQVIALLASNPDRFRRIISDVIPLESVASVLRDLSTAGSGRVKVLVEISRTADE